jgi:hypothetical protein
VDLVGAREVLVGRRDHGSVRVLQPVEPVLQPLHRDAAHVDDIAAHLAVIGGDQRAHQVAILEDQFGVLQYTRVRQSSGKSGRVSAWSVLTGLPRSSCF